MSAKNCLNSDVSGSEMFHNIRKEWIEQVIWKTKHPIFIFSEHFDKTGAPTKPIDYLYLKITCFTLSSFM